MRSRWEREEEEGEEEEEGIRFTASSVMQERVAAIRKHFEADKEKLQKIRALLVSTMATSQGSGYKLPPLLSSPPGP